MDVVAAFVADAQPSVLVQPRDRPLDDPALAAKPGAVVALWPGDLRLDVTPAQLTASFARVVSAIAVEAARPAPRPATTAAHRGDRVNERDELADVVAVAAGEREGKRRAAATGD
jgi:hypothetical protein